MALNGYAALLRIAFVSPEHAQLILKATTAGNACCTAVLSFWAPTHEMFSSRRMGCVV